MMIPTSTKTIIGCEMPEWFYKAVCILALLLACALAVWMLCPPSAW